MTKISILSLHLSYGGVEKAIINEANQLCDDYEVEIAVTYKISSNPAFYLNPKVKIKYLTDVVPNKKEVINSLKHFKLITFIKEAIKAIKVLYLKEHTMKEYIKNTDSDIIISSRIEYTKLLRHSTSLNIAEEHRHHNNDRKYINRLRKALKGVDYLVNVSKDLNDFYTKEFPFIKCVLLPNSLDKEDVPITDLSRKNIVSVGRLSHEKGFPDLIDVFNIINKKDKNITLDIIGEGAERNIIESKVKDYNLENVVTLHGFKDRGFIKETMKTSSLYIMTSYEESFGLVLIEAGIEGLPQIAFTSAQGANELIENGKNGYLIKNRNKEEMANIALDVLNNKKLLKELSEGAIRKAKNYSYESTKEMWLNFIKTALKGE